MMDQRITTVLETYHAMLLQERQQPPRNAARRPGWRQ
jgi:hypothetical protein